MAKLSLTYEPKTGHVKRNAAVIGRVEHGVGSFSYIPFRFNSELIEADSLRSLLLKVRQSVEGATLDRVAGEGEV